MRFNRCRKPLRVARSHYAGDGLLNPRLELVPRMLLVMGALAGLVSPALATQRTPTRIVALPPPPKPVEPGPWAPPRVVEGPSRARGNIAAYISDSDYPPAAIRAQEQGRVAFRLGIGADGRVTTCTITASSGSATLDDTTCRILQNRARFVPARDARGVPVEDSVTGALNWILPPEPPPPSTVPAPALEPPSSEEAA